MMGQEASTLAREYGPQWMNIPNLACLNQKVRCASASALAGGGAACWALLTEEIPNSRMKAVRLSKHFDFLTRLFTIRSLLVDSDCITVSTHRPNRLAMKPGFPARRHREYKRAQGAKVRRFY
jgi:hypothetical protein